MIDLLRGHGRKIDGECRPLPFTLTEGVDRAAVELDQVVHERQSDAQAAMAP